MPRKKTDSAEKPKKTRKRAEKKTEDGKKVGTKRQTVPKKKKVVAPVLQTSTVDDLLDCQVQNPNLVNQLTALGFRSKNPEGMTYREAIIAGQITNAVRGDIDAYKAVMADAGKREMMPLEEYVLGDTRFPMEFMIGG